MNVSSVLSAGSSFSRSGVKCIYKTVGEKSCIVALCSWGELNFTHSFAAHLETQTGGGGGNQVILSLSLMKVHSEMWEGRRWSLTSGCLAYQHPAAGEVTGFRREPELMMAIENAEATYWPGSMGIEG